MQNLIPQGASRVQVTDEYGKVIWRKPSDLKPTDRISYNPQTGEPIVMYGTPGKPSTQANASIQAAQPLPNATVSSIRTRRKDVIETDEVLEVARKSPDSSDLLSRVIEGLAEESASLAFERAEAERRGESTAQISIKRVQALKAVGDTWLKKKEIISSKGVDLESPAFKIIFSHIAETFRKACDDSGLRPEMAESVFAEFGKLVDDPEWVKEALARVDKGKA
jgi:hypothetical protein